MATCRILADDHQAFLSESEHSLLQNGKRSICLLLNPRWIAAWIALAMGFFVAPLVLADDRDLKLSAATDSPTQGELKDPDPDLDNLMFKDLLSTGDYRDRQQATLGMWRRRDLNRDLVQRASRDADPEIAGRARWVLRQWQRGILADTPAALAKRLQDMPQSQAIDTLMSVGRFRAVAVAFEESAGTSDWEERRDQIESLIFAKYPIYIHNAERRGQLQSFANLMGRVAKSRTMAISRVELLRSIGSHIPDDQLLPESAVYWSNADRLVGLVQILVVLGRRDDALDLLTDSNGLQGTQSYGFSLDVEDEDVLQRRTQLREVCRLLGRQWRPLCDELSAQSNPESDVPYEHVWFHSRLLIAADRCGDTDAKNRAMAGLREIIDAAVQPDSTAQLSPFEQRLVWASLCMHGGVAEAEALLEKTDALKFAEIAYARSEPSVALERLGFPVEELEPRLAEIVANCPRLHPDVEDGREGSTTLATLQSLFRFLFAAGRNDLAWQLCNEISRVPVLDDRKSGITPRELLAYYLSSFGKSEWKQHFELYPGQNELTNRTPDVMAAGSDFDIDHMMWRKLNDAFLQKRSSSALHDRARWIRQVTRGEVPEEFRREDFAGWLYVELTTSRATADTQSFDTPAGDDPIVLPMGFADLFMRLGRSDLWLRCVQALQSSGDLEASMVLADWVRRNGRVEDAAEMYTTLIGMIAGDQALEGFVSVPEAVKLAVTLPIKQQSLAATTQDEVAQDRQRRLIDMLACSPTPLHRRTLLQSLSDEGDDKVVRDIYQRLLAFMAMEQDDLTDFVDVTGRFATLIHEKQPSEATKWMELRLVAMVQHPDGYSPGTYLANAMICEGFRLEAAIKADDVDRIQRTIQRIEQLDPLEINHLESVLPSLTKAGHRDIVVATLDRVVETANDYFDRGHRKADELNNLAWSLAVNDYRLDVALLWSRRSVALEPETAIYRDTLAEILFRQGKVDQAIQIEKACVLDDPGEHHLYQQIERFEAKTK